MKRVHVLPSDRVLGNENTCFCFVWRQNALRIELVEFLANLLPGERRIGLNIIDHKVKDRNMIRERVEEIDFDTEGPD